MSYESASFQWQEGLRRLDQAASRDEQAALDRVVAAIVVELRRRLGGRFSVEELADLHAQGLDWCLDVAMGTEPEEPATWDLRVADAAFATYAREAVDYAGGRRR